MSTKTSKSKQSVVANQSGLVSIMMTIIMVLVISLIVLGFAQITRHAQRQNLDSQLSSQAYYAAESGVNDAITKLHDPANATAVFNNTNCTGAGSFMASQGLNNTLSPNVSYTCLLVNNTPSSLQWQTIANGRAVAVPLNTTTPLNTLTVTWDAANATQTNAATCSSGAQQLPPSSGAGAWGCSYGLLRLDLMQDNGANNAAAAANNTVTFYLKPASSSTPKSISNFASATKAYLANTTCVTATAKCTATIALSGGAVGSTYYARIAGVYNDLHNVVVTGQSGVAFKGALATIDSTGKAQDVLRRIQVYVPLTSNATQTAAAVQTSGSICKLIIVISPIANDTCPGGPTSGGDPAATPAPPSAGLDGDAHFGACPGPSCPVAGGGAGAGAFSWFGKFVNTSVNAPSVVESCTWEWGDGAQGDPAPVLTGSPTNAADACLNTQTISHKFYPASTTGPFNTCYHYQVVLTVNLVDGSSKQYSHTISKPTGSGAPAGCV